MTQESAAVRYRSNSTGLYILFWLAVPCVAFVVPVVASTFIEDGTWSVVAAIASFWFSIALALELFKTLRSNRTAKEYELRFPGFRGARFPIFYLLNFEDSSGVMKFDDPDLVYSLGEADDCLFLMQNKRPDDVATMPPGELVTRAAQPLALRLDEITDVAILERSDEEIAGSAVDRRDFAERLGSQVAQSITGTRIKTKIIPYAAFIVITSVTARGEQRVALAVPTNVKAEVLSAMGQRVADDRFETPWLVDTVASGVGGAVLTEIDDGIAGVVGEPAADAMQKMGEMTETVGEAAGWFNPDAAVIETTAGARGRRMAQLIALRISQRAGRALVVSR